MKVKRQIVTTKELPNYYFELFYNADDVLVGKVPYKKETYTPCILSIGEKEIADKLVPKEFEKIDTKEYKEFFKKKGKFISSFSEKGNDEDDERFEIKYGDVLSDGAMYFSLYAKEELANLILRGAIDSKDMEFAFFAKGEIDYPTNLYFLAKSVKVENKVVFFKNLASVDSLENCFAVYKTSALLYVAQLKDELEVVSLKVYDLNYFAELNTNKYLIEVLKEIEDKADKRLLIQRAKKYQSYFQ